MPRCPVCKDLCARTRYEEVPLYQCGQCGGYWLTYVQLDRICSRREIQMPEPVQQKMMDLADASNSTQTLWCLGCGKEMIKEQFKFWDDIQLDRCPKCNGVWLDCGELEKCQIYWEYAQDNPDQWENRDAYERSQLLQAEWMNRQAEVQRDPNANRPHPGYWGELGGVDLGSIFSGIFGSGRRR